MNTIVKPALLWYSNARESLDITSFILRSSTKVKAAAGTKFENVAQREVKRDLDQCKELLERVAVVLAWAYFESAIKHHFKNHTETLPDTQSNRFDKLIVKTGLRKADHWKIVDILDSYKGKVEAKIVGNCKKVYAYRNWVAHDLSVRPDIVSPAKAVELLGKFLDQADIE